MGDPQEPLDDDAPELSEEEKAEKKRAEEIERKMLLARECKTVLGLHSFMAMLEDGAHLARTFAEKAVDDMQPIEVIQRHAGAKKAILDLIHDIKRKSEFKPPAPKPEKKARPMYE